jgi:ligand-binding sensor domain-containing protein
MPGNIAYKHFFLAAFLLLLVSLNVSSQEYNYVRYDVKDGLAGSTVYHISEDKDGFLWFGTETGLSRFDGTHFKNFYTSDGLPDNEIINLFVDSKNRVWIVPFKNSICYYWKGKIHNSENDTLIKQLNIHSEIASITENKTGTVLIAEANTIHLIDSSNRLSTINEFNGSVFYVLKTGLDSLGKFEIALVQTKKRNFYLAGIDQSKLVLSKDMLGLGPNSYFSIELSPELEITKRENLFHMNILALSKEVLVPVPENFNGFSRINDSSIFINSHNGTFLFDIRSMKIIDSFFSNQTVNAVAEDRETNLWFSVLGKGVFRLSSGRFINYIPGLQRNKPVFSIQKIDSLMYIGSEGFYLWTLTNSRKFGHEKRFSGEPSRGRVTSIVNIDADNIVAGTDYKIFRLRKKDFNVQDVGVSTYSVKSVYRTSKKNMLVSTSNGTFNTDIFNLNHNDTIWAGRSTCSYYKNRLYYIGTLNGLYIIDSNNNVTYAGDHNNVFKSRINAIGESNDGTLWIATNGSGIAAFRNNKIVLNVTEADGLTSNICRNIFISSNAIWVGTDKGLNRVAYPYTGAITTFTSSDGLSSDIINAVYADSNDVYVGTPDGLNYFNENAIAKTSVCKLRITAINTTLLQLPADTTSFTLAHKNNNIDFQFVGISYKSAGKIIYQYRLIGLDTVWRTTTQTSLSYLSLPSGIYQLQIRAKNKFAVQSNIAVIDFSIEKTLFEKNWFRLLILAAIAVLLWVMINYRIGLIQKRERERADTLGKIAELEQMALKSQMNPHFIFNCLNSIQHYVIDKDVVGANEFISNFSRLIRLTLDNSSKTEISIADEIDYITTYLGLEQKRFEDKFTYEIIAAGVMKHHYFIPPMLLQPYVENAVRHGVRYREDNQGKITITFENKNNQVLCTIKDNGIGRKLSGEYKSKNPIVYQSKGMELVARRIEMFNKTHSSKIDVQINDLENELHEPMGTEIIICFPVEQKNNETL